MQVVFLALCSPRMYTDDNLGGIDRAVSRSYTEFTSYVSALSVTCPQSIIPALPLPQTSAATDEEDDRILKQQYQKWVVRLMQDQAVVRDEETRSFVENDFGVRLP